MPTNGEHLVVGQGEACEEEDDDGFLTVSEREVAVDDVVSRDVVVGAVGHTLACDGRFVEVGFAGVVEERRDDDAILGQRGFDGGVESDHVIT